MINLFKTLLIKIIPTNWYEIKKVCDIVNKLCDTLIELKWFVFPSFIIMMLSIGGVGIYYFRYKIVKITKKKE
jgi:hypothetical protein